MTNQRISIDEINNSLTQIARDPEAGADRFRALKMLASMESAAITLPEPMKEGEILDRLARVMKGAGLALTQQSYVRAFPSESRGRHGGLPTTYPGASKDVIEEANKVTTLRQLNKKFPEAKLPHVPPGYPSGRSLAAKAEWCRNQALKLLVERQNFYRQTAHKQLNPLTREPATDGEPTSEDPRP